MCTKQHDNGLPPQRISLLKRKTSTRFSLPMFPILNNLHRIHNTQLPHKLNRHLPNSQPFQTVKPSRFKSYFGKHCTPFTSTPALVGAKQVPHHAISHLKSNPHVSLSAY